MYPDIEIGSDDRNWFLSRIDTEALHSDMLGAGEIHDRYLGLDRVRRGMATAGEEHDARAQVRARAAAAAAARSSLRNAPHGMSRVPRGLCVLRARRFAFSTGVTDHSCRTADERDRPVSSGLKPPQHHQLHHTANMQRIRSRIKSDVHRLWRSGK